MGCILPKKRRFCKFSKLNISVIFNDRASFIITDIWKLIFCLSKKFIFNDLELLYQGQMAHVFGIGLFSSKRATRLSPNTFKTSEKTYRLVLNVINFSDF